MNIRILPRKVILRGHGNERNFVKLQLDIDGDTYKAYTQK